MEDIKVIKFKSPEDLNKLSPDDPAYATVKELVDQLITAYTPPGRAYDAEEDGYVILIEEGDVNRELDELWEGCTLLNLFWEGIFLRNNHFVGIWLANNEYGLTFVIPDADWVNGELRTMIKDILDPLPTDTQLPSTTRSTP